MKNPDYLIMCSDCEVRIHPDDYKKHKKTCQQAPAYVPYPVYPAYPTYPDWRHWQPPLSPYVYTTTTGTATYNIPEHVGNVTFIGSNS